MFCSILLTSGCATTAEVRAAPTEELPRVQLPVDVCDEVTACVRGERAGRVLGHHAEREIGSASEARRELVAQYPEYDDLLECWTRAAGHYVLSLRLEDTPAYAYHFVVKVAIGGRMFQLYVTRP